MNVSPSVTTINLKLSFVLLNLQSGVCFFSFGGRGRRLWVENSNIYQKEECYLEIDINSFFRVLRKLPFSIFKFGDITREIYCCCQEKIFDSLKFLIT